MIGAIAGDIIGSWYEFRPLKSKTFDPLFHAEGRITDDTVCTIAIAEALLDEADPVATLQAWCRRHWIVGGWGKQFIRWVASDTPTPYGSCGNGSAMRVSAAGFLARSLDDAIARARHVTAITHDHPEGLKAGEATAAAIWLARQGETPQAIAQVLKDRWQYEVTTPIDDIRPTYRRSELAQDSVPQAIACALQADDFDDALRNAVSLGGDADTMACIAGAVAEARFGVSDEIRTQVMSYLTDDMREVVLRLYAAAH